MMQGDEEAYECVVILPVLNESAILEQSVEKLVGAMEKYFLPDERWVIVIADNGSHDETALIAARLCQTKQHISFFSISEKGRGNALRNTVSRFNAHVYLYSDIDIPVDAHEMVTALDRVRGGSADVVVIRRTGSRPLRRRIISYLFRMALSFLFCVRIADAQAGVKAFSRAAADTMKKECFERGYFLDTEFLIACIYRGLTVTEIPAVWIEQRYQKRISKVHLFSDSLSALRALWRITLRWRKDMWLDRFAYSLFALVIAVPVVVSNPFGNYPLYDDWTPALSVDSFLKSGTIFYPAYLSAFSLVPILYGIVISSIVGFSFGALRLVTVFLAWGCACLLYSFLRENNFSPRTSIDATLLMVVSPIFVFLSLTFMSDITGLFFLLVAVYLFSRGLREGRYRFVIAGVLYSLFGFLTRQFNIVLLLVAAGSVFFSPFFDRKRGVFLWGGAGLIFISAWTMMTNMRGISPTPITLYLSQDGLSRISQSLLFAVLALIFFAITLSPFIISRIAREGMRVYSSRTIVYAALFAIACSTILYYALPRFLTVFSYFGLGTVPFFMRGDILPWGRPEIYIGIFAICMLLAVWFLRHAGIIFRGVKEQSWNLFLLYFGVLYAGGLIVFLPFFDRYLLFLLPVISYIGAHALERHAVLRPLYYVVLSLIAVYSIVGSYNYIAWNDARWRLGERVVSSGIPRADINGGYEWNGWFFYKDGLDAVIRKGSQSNLGVIIDNFLFFRNSEYLLSFSQLPAMHVIDAEEVRGFFSNIKTIYALQKEKSD